MRTINIYLFIFLTIFLAGCVVTAETQDNTLSISSSTVEEINPIETTAPTQLFAEVPTATELSTATEESFAPHPLQIEVMRQQSYQGSELIFEQTLSPGENYSQYVVSYQSEGYKIYALMTIPNGAMPDTGWPSIVFNHGYIDPAIYRTTERYVSYVDAIARSGYIVLKIDYRGHGSSDGSEVVGGGYGTPGYTADALNAVASLQMYPDVDPDRIGMWGHSMGGQVVLRAMVVSGDIKAGVIWGGVVAPYPVVIERWDFTRNLGMFSFLGNILPQNSSGIWLQNYSDWVSEFSAEYGEPEENLAFWVTISPNSYLADLSGPIQLHHSTTDEMVPLEWSQILAEEMQRANMPYEFFTYEGDNHNISGNFWIAMQRTIDFFDLNVKGQ